MDESPIHPPPSTLLLPSDHAWRMKKYFKLLDEQKSTGRSGPRIPDSACDAIFRGNYELSAVKPVPLTVGKCPDWCIATDDGDDPEPKRPRRSPGLQGDDAKPEWQARDILKAAKLLARQSSQLLQFTDEEEMRRVFTLIYDVFRYKTILKQALDETGFMQHHPQYGRGELNSVTWLLLYELYRRRFLPREHDDELICSKGLAEIELAPLEQLLWSWRIKLAAALARNRIAHCALLLNHLLPFHLQDERLISVQHAPVTAWINTFITSKSQVLSQLEAQGISFRLDHVCPKLLSLPASFRSTIAMSSMVKENMLVLQDRSFCVGATIASHIILELCLQGVVVQSHVISPRATAYLTAVLLDNPNIHKIVAYGAADRLDEYRDYLDRTGVEGCELRAERWSDVKCDELQTGELQDVAVVIATPPCSWTGVGDPVELVCARNGDLEMLRAMTQARRGRDPILLKQQRDTLMFSMSLPQVQVVVFESHSLCPEETASMVHGAVDCLNQWAREKHTEEQRLLLLQEEAQEKQNKVLLPGGTPAQREQREREAAEAQEARVLTPMQVNVPLCDLFQVLGPPHICTHGTQCIEEEGCYIAVLQRKEIIGLDAKYMIKIAEARGLFGTDAARNKKAIVREQKKSQDLQIRSVDKEGERQRPRRHKIEMERISAHTHASLARCVSGGDMQPVACQRFLEHARHLAQRIRQMPHEMLRTWWHLTVTHVINALPLHRLTPRSMASVLTPAILHLPRIYRRQTLPMHTVRLACRRNSY